MQSIIPTQQILCLHGYTQNKTIFSKRMKVLSNTLSEIYNLEFLYPNAPFLLNPNKEVASEEEKLFGWLYFDEEDKLLNKEKIKEWFSKDIIEYKGFSASQMLLETYIKCYDNIVCLLGFSQGALIATLLLIQAAEKKLNCDLLRNLKCCILISGLGSPTPSNEEISSIKEYSLGIKQINVPVLIVIGKNDDYITKQQSESLFKYFKNYEVYEHDGKHYVPSKKEDLQVYSKFLEKNL